MVTVAKGLGSAEHGKAFETMFARIQEGLRSVFHTRRPVFVSSSSATGLMEAAVRCAPPGPILAVVNGAFSSRFVATRRSRAQDISRTRTDTGTRPSSSPG